MLKLDGFIVHNLIAVGWGGGFLLAQYSSRFGPSDCLRISGVPAGQFLSRNKRNVAYAAVFVGMTAGDAGVVTVLMASILLCAIYTLTREWCVGVGGRLGTSLPAV